MRALSAIMETPAVLTGKSRFSGFAQDIYWKTDAPPIHESSLVRGTPVANADGGGMVPQ
jgi:hypothetical protein